MKKYILTTELLQEIRENAKKTNLKSSELRTGHVIMCSNFKDNYLTIYLPIKLLEGIVINNEFVGHFEPGFGYHEEGKNWELIPYRFNEQKDNLRGIKKTLLANHGGSVKTVDKFLMITPMEKILYSYSPGDIRKKIFPRDISDNIEIKSFKDFTQEEKQIISKERKKLDELTLQFHKQTIETTKDVKKLERIFQKVGGKDYNPKLLKRGYLFYEDYE